ncbi:MAG TPA: BACON domain-containing protein [Bryobacteraceae bacterium]|nr:BACON domain-containing protein [Bryobacteraceae bacterium]
MFDTHQIVLAPDGSGLAINHYEASYASDEHSSVFAPGTLGSNNDYLFFVGSGSNASAGIGTMVLSGRSGPDDNGQWTFDIPKADGYGAYSGGFGQVFRQPFPEAKCPAVANPTQQDATFDLDYAAPGSVLKDPTGPAGSLLMIYEGANDCAGNSGGNRTGLGAYISVAVATSLDYGKTWPTYRGTSTFNFVPLPGANQTQGPNAPLGARGANVCLGNDCSTTPPAAYGRYPVLMPSPSITSVISSGQPLNGSIGASNMSAFLDDVSGAPAPYVYVVYNSRTVNDLAIARGQLNGGSAPLSFSKWNGTSFSAPGVGGTEAQLLPNGVRQNCGAAAQTRQNGSIDFLDATQQYVLFFTCTSNGDPALPSGTGIYGAAWFYSTSTNLSDPTTWSTPQEIAGSWVPFDTTGQCNSYPGWYHTWMSLGEKPGHLSTAGHVFYLWGCEDGSPTAPPRQYSSRMFTITTSVPIPTPFVDAGQAMPTSGGSGSVTLTFPAGYSWTASTTANWITITSSLSGTGSGMVSFSVSANSGGDRTASIIVAGFAFTIEQEAASLQGLSYIGSMPHIAAEENWTTAFTLVNKGTSPATARLSFFGDPSGSLTLPLAFPQVPPPPLPELAASLDRTISTNASVIIDSAGPQTPPVKVGSAQLAATGAVDGFAIFHLIPGAQEAVVPMETRNASSYLLPFDNTAGVVLGVAVENVSAQAAAIPVVIRDDAGTVIGPPGAELSLAGNGHYSFVLSTLYPVTAGKRGTIEFDTPSGGQISVLGIRTTPLGTTNTLTTIPALASVGTSGGSIAHIATGNGWQTTFVLVNTGASAAQVHLKFFADVTGAPLSLPLSFPQAGGGATTVTSSVNQSLAAGATLLVQSAAPLSNPTPIIGSAQLTTNGNVGGFVIFRYNPNGQEAVVPLESRTANAYILAFDNTNGTATGVAINSVSSQAVNVPVIVRDDAGTQITTDILNLAPNGHLAFTLATDKYPTTANIRGTIEFDTPSGAQIGALGIRIPIAHTFTTLPTLAK